jgi:hypothetical protein
MKYLYDNQKDSVRFNFLCQYHFVPPVRKKTVVFRFNPHQTPRENPKHKNEAPAERYSDRQRGYKTDLLSKNRRDIRG